jgi:hypothetical protein
MLEMDELKEGIKYITLAGTGGAARYLHSYLEGTPFSWKHLFAKIFISGFAGLMVSQIASQLNPDWKFIAAGIGGFAGTQALDFIIYITKKKFDSRYNNNAEDETHTVRHGEDVE